jgi:hypothetical protein
MAAGVGVDGMNERTKAMPHSSGQVPADFFFTTMERENLDRLRQAFSYSPATASLPAPEPPRCPYCEERELRARAKLLGIWLPPMEG